MLQNKTAAKNVYVSKLIVRDTQPALLLDAQPSLLRFDPPHFRGIINGGDFSRYYDANIPRGYLEIYPREKNYYAALTEHFQTTPVLIDNILYDAFISEWQKRNLIPLIPSLEPDAIIKLKIIDYGFMLKRSASMAPYMMVEATMVNASNKIIWQEEVKYELFLVGPQNSLRLQQWLSRPKHLEDAFKKVAQIVSASIIDVIADD